MKRLLVLAALLALASAPIARAEDTAAAKPAGGEKVTFTSGTEKGMGELFLPEGKGTHPAVLVIQEWWGLDDFVRDQARALAKEGYVALAVDLYRGKVTADQEEAHQLMMGLSPDRAMRDLHGAVAWLKARADVRKDRIGVIGWCMGGRYTLALTTEEPTLAAAVAYYGAPPTDPKAIAAIKAPILGNYGGEDKGPAPDDVKAFEAAMQKAGKTIDVKVYPGAPHAFANPNNPWKGYRPEAAADAWSRTTAWFAKYLKK
jgi:carboxymethylenebutenolidase